MEIGGGPPPGFGMGRFSRRLILLAYFCVLGAPVGGPTGRVYEEERGGRRGPFPGGGGGGGGRGGAGGGVGGVRTGAGGGRARRAGSAASARAPRQHPEECLDVGVGAEVTIAVEVGAPAARRDAQAGGVAADAAEGVGDVAIEGRGGVA